MSTLFVLVCIPTISIMLEGLILGYFKARYFGVFASVYVYACCSVRQLIPDLHSSLAAICGSKTGD